MKTIVLPSINIKDRPHILLTGFMGAGKTTVGSLLATQLKRPFIDTDAEVQRQTGMTAAQYIRRCGEAAFRQMESRFLNQALMEGPSVIAPGGGAILNRFSRKRMLARGFVCWLSAPVAVLLRRLESSQDRPLLAGPDPKKKIQKLLWERIPLYEESHYQLDTSFKKPEQISEEIVRYYESRLEH